MTADPIATLETCLLRIQRFNPALNAFLSIDAPAARAAARASAHRHGAGTPVSAVDGMVVGVKANIAVAGMAWHAGISAYAARIATADADAVARLRAAGAIILGILNMDEGALGALTDNETFGRTENPFGSGHTAGGSSGGAAAAVAAGFCAAALGTDTLGSVRIPAAYCGVIGHKPATGHISLDGVVPLAPGLDTLGIIAGNVGTCTHVLENLLAWRMDERMPSGPIGVLTLGDQVELDLNSAAAFDRAVDAAQRAGLDTVCVSIPGHDAKTLRRAAWLCLCRAAAAQHEPALIATRNGVSDGFRASLAWGAAQPEQAVREAERLLADSADAIAQAIAPFAAVLCPAVPGPAPRFGDRSTPAADFTCLANITGYAATCFPMGSNAQGLPVAAMIMSRLDATTLAVARILADPRLPK
jgi:aspartyl-tRNA(Asn)/glutamyl-tRNA(Gln) amidotransferase subunit A